MGILDTIGNVIWAKLEPLITARLNSIQEDAKAEIAAWRKDSMAMLSEALPEMAGAVAEQAVKTTFEHTQVDEAANAVSGVITDIIGRLRLPFGAI
ncbi:hypothetical protein A5761_14940 [Mycolicibacterium setense]|uniref:hypothetical protein n=1 Tax=Mycolicibacterium setense TaxID=431269 RepID=UPI0003A2D12A|nr:hypothetical protein [Mycolicibacterium setense]OBB15037.1 hypothetical protein A5761_14940 [Mycolicibacterium setense]